MNNTRKIANHQSRFACLIGLLFLVLMLSCENATENNPSLPLGTKIILNDGREAWTISWRLYSKYEGCYNVRYATDNGYKKMIVWESEFQVSEANSQRIAEK
jgi:hypothetical protein